MSALLCFCSGYCCLGWLYVCTFKNRLNTPCDHGLQGLDTKSSSLITWRTVPNTCLYWPGITCFNFFFFLCLIHTQGCFVKLCLSLYRYHTGFLKTWASLKLSKFQLGNLWIIFMLWRLDTERFLVSISYLWNNTFHICRIRSESLAASRELPMVNTGWGPVVEWLGDYSLFQNPGPFTSQLSKWALFHLCMAHFLIRKMGIKISAL